jgi:PhnB protein
MAQRATNPIPKDFQALTPELWFNGNCREAIDFYKRAFNAEQIGETAFTPEGKVLHALLRIGGSNIMLADTMGSEYEKGPERFATTSYYLYVQDSDSVFKRAVEAGCRSLMPVLDTLWGDRTGQVRDPYGHCWSIATNKWILTPEEMKQHQAEWLEQHHDISA